MIINNYQFFMEIPLDFIPKIIFVILIILLIPVGLLFNKRSTESLLKIISHRYIIFISILAIIWSCVVYWIFSPFLLKFYSNTVIFLTIIFSTFITCYTAYKWAEDNSFFKNMIKDNFKKNSIFGALLGIILSLLSLNFNLIIDEFIKSLFLPLILDVLFLPLFYLIAVINEYIMIYNLLPRVSSKYGLRDVFNKYKLCLKNLHRFNKQLNYKLSNNIDVVLISYQSEFKLENNYICMGNELIGRYECGVKIPEITGSMSGAYTKEKNIQYIVGDWEIENSDKDMAFVYFTYKNVNVKLYVKIKYAPLNIWSPLIEDIYEFELL